MAGALASLDLIWHTVRHLRPRQATGRLRHLLRARFGGPPSDAPAPPLRRRFAEFAPPLALPATMLGADRFRFLNHEGRAAVAADWTSPGQTKLWRYNLHYFADLAAEGAPARAAWHDALIQRWIAENPPPHGDGWEPYPTSLRIVNWIKRRLAGRGGGAAETHSLARQARHLAAHVEWHLLGNHIFANAKALAFAGAHFDGAEAQDWLARATAILAAELDEQILADGGHFERSPMYHAIIAEDVLDLVNLSRAYPGALGAVEGKLRAAAPAMLGWLAVMTHPDGRIAFFNDAAFGIAGEAAALDAYAARLGLPVPPPPGAGLVWLKASGYARLAAGDQVAFLDMAPVGPDYLPGHAHADTLSFEWSVGAERVVVNGGVSVYGTGAERLRQRGTPAHSTVTVDGENSSQVWSGFRVARRARIVEASASGRDGALVAHAAHDGYRRLPGRNIHARDWTMTADALTVADRVTGAFRSARAHFHLAPGVEARCGEGLALVTPGGRRIAVSGTGAAATAPSQWNPEFGRSVATLRLAVDLPQAGAATTFRLQA